MTFEKTIVSTFGTSGRRWLKKLPEVVANLQEAWSLTNVVPVENMTYHYVAKAMRFDGAPVVIKIGCDGELVQNEAGFLRHFHEDGVISLIDYTEKYHALLLEQAIPGGSLRSLYPQFLDIVMQSYANVVQKMQSRSSPKKNGFTHVADVLKALDNASSGAIDTRLLSSAIGVKNHLLSTMKEEKLFHGDLHLDNILENKGKWVCIDPQGIIAEMGFEAAAFNIFDDSEITQATKAVFIERIQKLAKKMDLSSDRLRDWFFVRLVLSAIWSIEDGMDPSKAVHLALLLSNVKPRL